jgi:hypothetical protein
LIEQQQLLPQFREHLHHGTSSSVTPQFGSSTAATAAGCAARSLERLF